MDVKEIREWVQLAFIVLGGAIGLIAFFQNLAQRRLENAMKLVASFWSSLEETDMSSWHELFISSSEPAGAKPGHFVKDHVQHSIGDEYFGDAAIDGGAISRMADHLEIICHEIVKRRVDARYAWFELGQLLNNFHYWLDCTPSCDESKSLLCSNFPSIEKVFKKYKKQFCSWPTRRHATLE